MGKEVDRERHGGGEGRGCFIDLGTSFLRAFNGGDFRDSPRAGSHNYLSAFQMSFLGHGLHRWAPEGRGSSVQLVQMSAVESLVWFRCFSGPGAETQLRPRCYL